MRKMLLVLMIASATQAVGGPVGEAIDAYQAGECATAVEILEREAAKGNVYALYNLGYFFRFGECVPPDNARAFALNAEAAEAGFDPAQSQLGFMYANGIGTEVDYLKGAYWSYVAAEQGNDHARENLGDICFELGWAHLGGTEPYPQDLQRAWMWFSLAGDFGKDEKSHASNTEGILEMDGGLEDAKSLKARCIGSGFEDCD